MTDHLLLLVGLVAICVAITLALATIVVGSEDRQRIRRSLAAVAATGITGAPVLEEREEAFATVSSSRYRRNSPVSPQPCRERNRNQDPATARLRRKSRESGTSTACLRSKA